jgi:hypothetical protein
MLSTMTIECLAGIANGGPQPLTRFEFCFMTGNALCRRRSEFLMIISIGRLRKLRSPGFDRDEVPM